MANVKTSALVAKPAPASADLTMIVDVADTTMAPAGTNKKSTIGNIAQAIATILGLGTAAQKNASGATAIVASVSGAIVVGHLARFVDTVGTVQDGGVIPTPTTPGGTTGQVQFNASGAFSGIPGSVIATASGSSGAQAVHSYTASINQSGTAGYYAYVYNVQEVTTGNGTLKFNSVYQFNGTNVYVIDRYGRPIFPPTFPPTLTLGNGAGSASGGTSSVVGSDVAGYITITVGTAPVAGAAIVVLNFNHPFAVAPLSVMITPASSTAVNLASVWADPVGLTVSGFTIYGGTLAAGQTYRWYYRVHG